MNLRETHAIPNPNMFLSTKTTNRQIKSSAVRHLVLWDVTQNGLSGSSPEGARTGAPQKKTPCD